MSGIKREISIALRSLVVRTTAAIRRCPLREVSLDTPTVSRDLLFLTRLSHDDVSTKPFDVGAGVMFFLQIVFTVFTVQ